MAAEQVPTEECFTFALEYMDRTVLLKTNKPFDFNMLQLCNVASMVLKRPESPRKHVFRPRVHIPWAFNLDVPVISDNLLHRIVQGCIRRGLRNLDIGVYFTNADATQFQLPMITGMQANALTVSATQSAPNQPSNNRKRENSSINPTDEGPSKRFAQVQNVPEDVSPNVVHEQEEMETTAQQLCEDSDVAAKIIPASQLLK